MSQISIVPRVVIAIVATDEAKNLVGCLGSLRNLIFREFSVIICENGGHDAIERDVQELFKVPGIVEGDAEVADQLGAAEGRRFHLGDDKRVVRISDRARTADIVAALISASPPQAPIGISFGCSIPTRFRSRMPSALWFADRRKVATELSGVKLSSWPMAGFSYGAASNTSRCWGVLGLWGMDSLPK